MSFRHFIMPDQNNYIGATSLSLAANFKALMISLYNLETSLINAHNGSLPSDLRSWFADIRQSLKENLELLIQLLQGTFAFGKRLLFLQKYLSTTDRKDRLHLLKGMANMSDKALNISKAVIQRDSHISHQFSVQRSRFEEILCRCDRDPNQSTSRIVAAQPYNPSEGLRPQGTAGKLSITQSPRGQRPNMQTWIEANIAAVNPNGLEALGEVSAAFSSISNILSRFSDYWTLVWQECQSPSITVGEAAVLATRWNQDTEDVKQAIAQIAESSDAILVAAVGASVAASPQSVSLTMPRIPIMSSRLWNLVPRKGSIPFKTRYLHLGGLGELPAVNIVAQSTGWLWQLCRASSHTSRSRVDDDGGGTSMRPSRHSLHPVVFLKPPRWYETLAGALLCSTLYTHVVIRNLNIMLFLKRSLY